MNNQRFPRTQKAMPISVFHTPVARFRIVVAPAVLLLLTIVLWAVQPVTGATTDVTQWRPFSLSPELIVSLTVGFGAYVISMWIWSLKPRNPATCLFAISGVMTLLFTFAVFGWYMAAPVPHSLMKVLPLINMWGASGFGMVMICLFLIYPTRLPYWRAGVVATLLIFGLWTLLRTFGPYRDPEGVQLITFVEMLLIILMGGVQIVASRHDPRQRAIAVWLALSVFIGAGIFIALVAAPISLGRSPVVAPQYAFASFLLIYAGLAIGLVRYRLFELGGWAFQLIFHTGIALIILVIDTVLIGLLSLTPGIAFTVALFVTAFMYLPLRDYVWRRLTKRRSTDDAEIFRAVIETALKPSGTQRAQSWTQLLQDIYRPLERAPSTPPVALPRIEAEGLELHLPAIADAEGVVLRYPHNGSALFTPRDLAVAEQIVALMRHAEESRGAYDRGVSEERTRIARDIHDNIGAQMLRALHSVALERKDAMIRDTLADLRDVINNAQNADLPIDIVLADMRAETADRLSPHGIALNWRVDARTERPLLPARIHALRSLVREATSNTIKHAHARTLTVTLTLDEVGVSLRIEDDGEGFSVDTVRLGHGLDNMKSRAESLGGTFALISEGTGTRFEATIPYEREPVTP